MTTTELLPEETPEVSDNDACLAYTLTEEEEAEGERLGVEGPDAELRSFFQDPAQARAYAKAEKMKAILLRHGVPEVRIELRTGRPSPYGGWDAGFFVADMSHHTVSRYGANKTPCYALVRNGRSDLAGPLANGYGGWDLCYRIITFGYANHPGAGGPYVVPALTAGHFTIPKDSARRYTWGTEWEGGLSDGDWDRVLTNPATGKKMTFREFMGRTNAALEEALEIHEKAHLEHSSWTRRKIDRLHYTATRGIAEKARYRNPKITILLPSVNLKNVQSQFRRHLGLEPGKVRSLPGVKRIQKALNSVYKAGLRADGIVGEKTAEAWRVHEERVGVVGRRRVPDAATLGVLSKNRFRVKR